MASTRNLRATCKALTALLIVPLLLGNGPADYFIHTDPYQILPADGSVSMGTVVTVGKNEVFYRQPIGIPDPVIPSENISFEFHGLTARMEKGVPLIRSKALGSAKRYLIGNLGIFCAPPVVSGKRRPLGWSEAWGMMSSTIIEIKKLRSIQAQACVVDSDGDGAADKAFIADTARREDVRPIDIPPVSLSVAPAIFLPGLSEARLMFNGRGGLVGNLNISFQIFESGEPLSFDNGQMLIGSANLPQTRQFAGASYTVLSYDAATQTAKIRIDRPFEPGEYKVVERRVR